MTLWQRIIADLKERFLKFETPLGLFEVVCGIAGLFITFTHIQWMLHVTAVLMFGGAILYGLYSVLHNPIKKAVNIEVAKLAHMKRRGITAAQVPPASGAPIKPSTPDANIPPQ